MLYILAGLKSLKLSTETGPVGKFEPYQTISSNTSQLLQLINLAG